MIEWYEHSTAFQRHAVAELLDNLRKDLVELRRSESICEQKLPRLRKPEKIAEFTAHIANLKREIELASKAYVDATRTMCDTHLGIGLDDIVELVSIKGERLREPIVVEMIEFNLDSGGKFWLRVKGCLLRESSTGLPLLNQSFDLCEREHQQRLIKHN